MYVMYVMHVMYVMYVMYVTILICNVKAFSTFPLIVSEVQFA